MGIIINKAHTRSEYGFSLIELMVVISILSTLSLMVMPKYILFKIKAIQVEASQNLRVFDALAKSYKAENESIPASIWYGHVNGVFSCGNNALGFSVTDCNSKMRYAYFYNVTNVNEDGYFLNAQINYSSYQITVGFFPPMTMKMGSPEGPPTGLCKPPADSPTTTFNSGEIYFAELWSMLDGVLRHDLDATKNCL